MTSWYEMTSLLILCARRTTTTKLRFNQKTMRRTVVKLKTRFRHYLNLICAGISSVFTWDEEAVGAVGESNGGGSTFYNGRRSHLIRTDLFSKCTKIFSVFQSFGSMKSLSLWFFNISSSLKLSCTLMFFFQRGLWAPWIRHCFVLFLRCPNIHKMRAIAL